MRAGSLALGGMAFGVKKKNVRKPWSPHFLCVADATAAFCAQVNAGQIRLRFWSFPDTTVADELLPDGNGYPDSSYRFIVSESRGFTTARSSNSCSESAPSAVYDPK